MIKKKYVLVSRYNFNDNFRSANFVSHFFFFFCKKNFIFFFSFWETKAGRNGKISHFFAFRCWFQKVLGTISSCSHKCFCQKKHTCKNGNSFYEVKSSLGKSLFFFAYRSYRLKISVSVKKSNQKCDPLFCFWKVSV